MALTERSYFWTTGTTNDGATTFTQADLAEAMRILAACNNSVGVAGGYLNGFAATIPGANLVQIDTGAAIVDGKPYSNLGVGNVAIPSAVGGGNTRIDRIVLRADWANHQVRITRIAGTDAASPTVPNITQVAGTTFDVLLYRVTVNTSGIVTVTLDERQFAQISALSQIANELITPAKLLNRTRNFVVAAQTGFNATDGTYTGPVIDMRGVPSADNKLTLYAMSFEIPQDYVSSLKVYQIWIANSSGNASLTYAIKGENYGEVSGNDINTSLGATIVALVANTVTLAMVIDFTALSLSPSAGQLVTINASRRGADAGDTINDTAYFVGWQVTYTADS